MGTAMRKLISSFANETKPRTGKLACCARAVKGHAAAAPPNSVMNSRRKMVAAAERSWVVGSFDCGAA